MKIFPGNPNEDIARALYEAIVAQARQPALYRDLGVPDSVDGRFEMLLLHSFLVFHRLKGQGERASQLGQTLFDLLIFHLDQSIRQSGVGDLKVGPKLKAMGEAFYGRSRAYEAALESSDKSALQAALARNVFGTLRQDGPAADAGPVPSEAVLAALAGYVRDNVRALAEQPLDALLAGRAAFVAPPPIAVAPAREASHG